MRVLYDTGSYPVFLSHVNTNHPSRVFIRVRKKIL